jgi:hypothetical protein
VPLAFIGRPPRRLLVGIGGLVVLLVAIVAAALLSGITRSSSSCAVTGSRQSDCGVWWGSALAVNDAALPNAVVGLQSSTGRRLDVVHTYHRWDDQFPTTAEQSLITSGHELMFNWEPVNRNGDYLSWASIAAGKANAVIDAEAHRLAGLPTVLVSFSHEPEQNFHQHGTAAEFAAAFRYVHDRVQADGATNVSWVWDLQGLSDPVWLDRYTTMWPGNQYVDWIAWDPYNWGDCRGRSWATFAQTVTPFYNWLEAHGFGDKPFMLAEYGSVEKPGDANAKAAWYAGIPAALTKLPNLRALIYFNLPAPPANCNWQITTSAAATKAFGRLADSSVFAKTASVALS